MHRRHPLDRPVLRCQPYHLSGRRLCRSPRRSLRHRRTRCPAGHPASLRPTATTTQPCPTRRLTPRLTPPPPTAGHRPHPHPLPRQTPQGARRNLPQSGQERHQPLPCLRHSLRHPKRPTFHRGSDICPTPRSLASSAATSVARGGSGGGPTALSAVGSWLLQRGRDSLPATGSLWLVDAVGVAGAQGRSTPRGVREPE